MRQMHGQTTLTFKIVAFSVLFFKLITNLKSRSIKGRDASEVL